MDFGIVIDIETTGLNPKEDRIIEVGLLEFAVEGTNQPQIVTSYGGLEDPGQKLPDEIVTLTGLNNAVLSGQKINWSLVREYFDRASIVIAHNAEFDRSFLLARPELRDVKRHWACSLRHIDWRTRGFTSRRLGHLAADHGFVNPFAHRAIFDCATTFRLVMPYLAELTSNSYEPEVIISAVGSPFETKDILRTRGYKWNGELRVWQKSVLQKQREEEVMFLSKDVYQGPSRHQEERVFFN